MGRKFVLSARNFGRTKEDNKFILNGYINGFLSLACIVANGKALTGAINDILPECPNLGIGIDLNLLYDKPLTKSSLLTNKKGHFKNNIFEIFVNSHKNDYLMEIENEFRAQIENIQKTCTISQISSLKNVHLFPKIFKLVTKLAIEYNIPFVKTNYKKIYIYKSQILNINFIKALISNLFFNHLSVTAKGILNKTSIKTNDYSIDFESTKRLEQELNDLKDDTCTIEVSIGYNPQKKNATNIATDKTTEDKIKRLNFDITNYKK